MMWRCEVSRRELLIAFVSFPLVENLCGVSEIAQHNKSEKPGSRFFLKPEDNCPYSEEEIRRSMKVKTGRTLAEILRDLGPRP